MRKGRAKKREVLPDPVYNNVLVTKFINNLMLRGKKQLATRIFHDSLAIVAQKTNEAGLDVFLKALNNVTPQIEVRTRRIGGANYQIPSEIRPERKIALAMKWLIEFARKRNEKSMAEKLAAEIIAASKEEGGAFKKKEDTHKMAEANKAFAHFKF
ncbi:MAG: 30S ribosomal protein S7 [Bacteroidia bacterium]|jgi:small subunit ribosomal protein S7|nr:30S ribosomal protein S7 [Bacteroidia bacterium]